MSIQKNTPNFLKHSGLSFTTIINQTMERIKDPGALGIYCYLASKPAEWNICNKELARRFGKGRDYIAKQMNYLKELGLIQTSSVRDAKGKILYWETALINFVDTQNTENPSCGKKPRILKNQNLEKPESGKTGTINKRVKTNKTNKQIKQCTDDLKSDKKPDKSIKEIDDTFYPDYECQKLADHVAMKCNTTGAWLVKRFIEITKKSGLKVSNFNNLFKTFLEKQQPVRQSRDTQGGIHASAYF